MNKEMVFYVKHVPAIYIVEHVLEENPYVGDTSVSIRSLGGPAKILTFRCVGRLEVLLVLQLEVHRTDRIIVCFENHTSLLCVFEKQVPVDREMCSGNGQNTACPARRFGRRARTVDKRLWSLVFISQCPSIRQLGKNRVLVSKREPIGQKMHYSLHLPVPYG